MCTMMDNRTRVELEVEVDTLRWQERGPAGSQLGPHSWLHGKPNNNPHRRHSIKPKGSTWNESHFVSTLPSFTKKGEEGRALFKIGDLRLSQKRPSFQRSPLSRMPNRLVPSLGHKQHRAHTYWTWNIIRSFGTEQSPLVDIWNAKRMGNFFSHNHTCWLFACYNMR